MITDITYLGKIIRVDSGTVEVEVSNDIPSAAPIINGRLYKIGKHSSSENLSVYTDIHKLVLRHCAILGSTGSGKSNTTVSILKAILTDYVGSRIILVDPHGEYASAFPDAKVFKIGDTANPL